MPEDEILVRVQMEEGAAPPGKPTAPGVGGGAPPGGPPVAGAHYDPKRGWITGPPLGEAPGEEEKNLRNMSKAVGVGVLGIARSLGLAFGLFEMLKRSTIVSTSISTIMQLMGTLVDIILMPIAPYLMKGLQGLAKLVSGFMTFMQDPWGYIKEGAARIWEFMLGVWAGIKDTAIGIWNEIKNHIVGIWDILRDHIVGIWDILRDHAAGIWDSIKDIAATAWQEIVDIIRDLFGFGQLKEGGITRAFEGGPPTEYQQELGRRLTELLPFLPKFELAPLTGRIDLELNLSDEQTNLLREITTGGGALTEIARAEAEKYMNEWMLKQISEGRLTP